MLVEDRLTKLHFLFSLFYRGIGMDIYYTGVAVIYFVLILDSAFLKIILSSGGGNEQKLP